MQVFDLLMVLTGILSISEASPKPHSQSLHSNSHTLSASTSSRSSETRKHTSSSRKHVVTSSSHGVSSSSHAVSSSSHAVTSSSHAVSSSNHAVSSSTLTVLRSSHTVSSSRPSKSSKITPKSNTSKSTSASNKGTEKPTVSLDGTLSPSTDHHALTLAVPKPSETTLTRSNTISIIHSGYANHTEAISKSGLSSEGFPTSTTTSLKGNATVATRLSHSSVSTHQVMISPLALAPEVSATKAAGQCTEGTFIDAACFNELNLSEYLERWWALNEGLCNSKNAQFAECFYALETNYGPSDCAQINNDAACTQPLWNDFKNTTHGLENFYVAWNLWNTAGFFLDMWTAIGAAEESSQAGLGSIVALLDPPKKQNVALDYVLDALTFGFSLYAEGSLIMKALLRSTSQSSGLGDKMFPSGTVDGEYQDWSVVAANVGKCTDAFRVSVSQGLPLIENNITTFIQWSAISGLSGYRPPLHGLAENMTQSLNTYAIARILSTQGIVISRAPDTDVHALQTNGSQLNWDTGCGSGYDNLSICDTFFWDGVDTYGLTDTEHFTRSFHDELVSLFSPKDSAPPLTTGKLLFSGAQTCYKATGQNGGAKPLLDSADPSHIVCLSNVQVCTWDESGYGPFDSSCKNLPDRDAVLLAFGASGCRGEEESTTSIDVPRAYLGPGIYQNAKNIEELQVDDFCDNVDFKRRM